MLGNRFLRYLLLSSLFCLCTPVLHAQSFAAAEVQLSALHRLLQL
jgi:hypothetical protein